VRLFRDHARVFSRRAQLPAATRSLAVEYASRGIRVSAVSLGIIRTPVYAADSYERPGDQLPPLGRGSWPVAARLGW
jgi:NAD(P)-dependent dehydrogenase (short-subunit alcohol dehydrogenase family)